MKISNLNITIQHIIYGRKNFYFLTLMTVLCWGRGAAFSSDPALPPNIVIISIDHLEHKHFRIHEPNYIKTLPHMNQMVRKGIYLSGFYSTGTSVESNRLALLTGRLPLRHSSGTLNSDDWQTWGESWDSEIFLPVLLKQSSTPYVSAMIGNSQFDLTNVDSKNRLGFDIKVLVTESTSGSHNKNLLSSVLMDQELPASAPTNLTSSMIEEAVLFIQTQTNEVKPWFLYMPLDFRHENCDVVDSGYLVSQLSFDEKHPTSDEIINNEGHYILDEILDKIFYILETLNVVDNTFIVVTADEGKVENEITLRSATGGNHEEGENALRQENINVPSLVIWQGTIFPAEIHTPLWTPDLFTVCAYIAGVPIPGDRIFDGKNPIPIFNGTTSRSPHTYLFFEKETHNALIGDGWKILRNQVSEPWQLYDLETDFFENQNLAEELPVKVKELNEAFLQKKTEIHSYQVILEDDEDCECR